jgi:UDP-N-acetylmuramate--alanine ligase
VAISGSHGKTTATAMIADMFISANDNPTVFLGGDSNSFGNYRYGSNDLVIVEACEYKQNFLDLKPDVVVILNIDNDHTDYFKKEKDIVDAFKNFSKDSLLVVNADDKHIDALFNSTTVTFGIENKANFTAKNIKYNKRGYSFTVCAYDRPVGRINLSVIGKHNIYNALATFAVGQVFNVPFSYIKNSLENFSGVKRRSEFLGVYREKNIFADYAHHPNEILATLKAFEDSGKDFGVIFQPHTYSRTKSLLNDFVNNLKNQDLIIYKTFPAREEFDKDGSETTLYEKIFKVNPSVLLAMNEDELIEKLNLLIKNKKRIVFLGAGDIYDFATKLVKS